MTRQRAVLCCPLGSPEHREAEEEIQAWYRSVAGDGHPWLTEHLSKGLPTLEELRRASPSTPARCASSSTATSARSTSSSGAWCSPAIAGGPADLAGYARFRLSYRPRTQLTDVFSPFSNRVFVVSDAP